MNQRDSVPDHLAPNGLPRSWYEPWTDFTRSLRRRGRTAGTVSAYLKATKGFAAWCDTEGVAGPYKVTKAHVNRWTDDMLARGLAPGTVSINWRNARPLFKWLADEDEVPNPFDGADRPKDVTPDVPVVALDDIRAVLATCAGRTFEERRDNAMIRVLFDTGARAGELINLRVDGWDRAEDTVLLDGKTGPRLVPVSASTGEALRRYLRVRAESKHAHLPDMWLGVKGRLGQSAINQMLARRCEMAGVERINPHKFRHSFAHYFRVEGGSEGDLLYLAGWKSPAMAHRYGRSAAAARARDAARHVALGDQL